MPTLLDQAKTDLAMMVRTEDFAESVTYTPSGGSGSAVKGHFEEYFQVVDPVDAGVVTTHPAFIGKTEDMSTAKKGDTITRSSVTYNVLRAEKDGMGNNGMITLILSRDAIHS